MNLYTKQSYLLNTKKKVFNRFLQIQTYCSYSHRNKVEIIILIINTTPMLYMNLLKLILYEKKKLHTIKSQSNILCLFR